MNSKIKKIINKKNKSKIVCLTAYSKNIAEIVDNHADIVLVGDSLGSVLYNYKTTRKVNLKMMLEHTKSVRMGVKKSLLVIDLPYNTYRNKSEALKNSKKAIKETNCDAVKVEGGVRVKDVVRHLVKNKIPVLGHIGLTPQTVKGKFKSVGKTDRERKKLIRDAKALEQSGAFGMVLECVYSDISKKITKLIRIPTIGIGASVHCDGQVLVTDDILGLTDAKIKFVKKYINIKKIINSALLKFKNEVKSRKYPTKKYSY
ncbi:MAG: 3-methyl-2-oxobutanoate hydroxymethyltransferase [Candidatus Pelagibacter sp.]|tara:strand:+ start:822 stop:1598 length:777 start_codon:yes stop_codon:yes gene_type:complete